MLCRNYGLHSALLQDEANEAHWHPQTPHQHHTDLFPKLALNQTCAYRPAQEDLWILSHHDGVCIGCSHGKHADILEGGCVLCLIESYSNFNC